MASSYIRNLLAKEAAVDAVGDQSLSDTLKELFTTFFPSKEFLGPRPTKDGRLEFPVRTPTGAEHDINELSAGEKEVLYGYLRLRNTAPKNSVLLIDEPELHLNPRLISGLATFYHRHLGRALGNQLWLVTHSDTLIRDAVGQSGFNVFHMQPPGQYEGPNQATPVQVGQDLERLVIELVGDLAAYRPGAKIVVFEGSGDSQFDARMTCQLFPRFQASVNTISAGSKRRVAHLYEVLEQARVAGHLPATFYAIVDRDSEPAEQKAVPTRFQWDAYHIENYLLEPRFILRVLEDVQAAITPLDTVEGVADALVSCARDTIPSLVAHRLRVLTNNSLVECLDLGFDPKRTDVAVALAEAAQNSCQRMAMRLKDTLSQLRLSREETELTSKAQDDLRTDAWRESFRGRDVLRQFVHRHVEGSRYEPFRDLIVARMREAAFEPPGMQDVVDQITSGTVGGRVLVRQPDRSQPQPGGRQMH
jgi:AAA domain, putative AbiEii toxin, Type IV TA system/Protein of unknown function (DUF4435)